MYNDPQFDRERALRAAIDDQKRIHAETKKLINTDTHDNQLPHVQMTGRIQRNLPETRRNERCQDPIIERNVDMLRSRSDLGLKKYGTTVAGNPGDLRAWLVHALEEALDLANYLQRSIDEIDKNGNDRP